MYCFMFNVCASETEAEREGGEERGREGGGRKGEREEGGRDHKLRYLRGQKRAGHWSLGASLSGRYELPAMGVWN